MPDEVTTSGGSRPVPDPTSLTTALVDKALEAEEKRVDGLMDVLRARLDGMDKATDLRLQGIDHLPARFDEKIKCSDDVTDEKFRGVEKQFTALTDRMAEQKLDTKNAVDAAFQAAKDAVNLQTEASEKSISKSEASTTKQLEALSAQSQTAITGLEGQITDLKLSVERITAAKLGGVDQRSEMRNQQGDNRAYIALAVSVGLFVLSVAGFVIALAARP